MQDCAIVYGALRSGTTMLRLMIDAHPALCCTGEHDFLFDHLHRATDGWRYDRTALEDDRIYRDSGVTLREDLDGADALADMIAQIAKLGGGRLPVLMLHRAADRWSALRPDVPLVHFLRDPRDVARSSIGMGWAGNVWRGVNHWIATERAWQHLPQAVRDRAHVCHYETLLQDPEAELQRVCDVLGTSYDPLMLSYPERSTYSAPEARLAYQWKRKASPREIGLVEGAVGALLTDTGYEPSGHGPLGPGFAERQWLTWSSKAATFRFATRRYGLGTVLQHRLGRKLGLDGMRRRAQRRIDEQVVQYLK